MSDTTSETVEAAEKARKATAKRRARILAKSNSRMAVASGEKTAKEMKEGDDGARGGKKSVRRRRKRPAFMKQVVVGTSSEEAEVAKGNKQPAAEDASGDPSSKPSSNKETCEDDVPDVTAGAAALAPEKPERKTFSQSFRRRVKKKTKKQQSENPETGGPENLPAKAPKNNLERFQTFNNREDFFRVCLLLMCALVVANVAIVMELSLLDDVDRAKLKIVENGDRQAVAARTARIGEVIFSAMSGLPMIQNMLIVVVGIRVILKAVFSVLRLRFFPILSANFQDNAGRMDSMFGVVKLLGSIFDDTCLFIFGIVGYFLSVYYMGYIQ